MGEETNYFELLVTWLETHRTVNLLLILLYFVFIYFMHDPIVHLSIWVMNSMSLPVYNKVVKAISILLLILFTVFIGGQIKQYGNNLWLKIMYLLLTIGLIIAHFCTMFEMNIEVIHVFEYPFLTLLIFPLTKRFGAAVLFTIPFMLMDEWHQYIVLYPSYVDYFEFNDVMIDIYGCGLAMVALLVCGVRGQIPVKPIWKRAEFVSLAVALLALAIAIKTCFFSIYEPDKCSNTWLVLYRVHEPITFWRKFPGRDVVYHVMQPVEAFFAITGLALFYFGLDSFRKESTQTYTNSIPSGK